MNRRALRNTTTARGGGRGRERGQGGGGVSERLETAQTLSPTEWSAQGHQGRSFLKARRRRTRHAHRHSLRFAGGATAAAGGGWSGPPPRWHRRQARPTAAGALAGQPLRGEQLCGGGGVWLGVVRGGREGKRQRPPDSRGQGAGLGTRRGREVGARGGGGSLLARRPAANPSPARAWRGLRPLGRARWTRRRRAVH